MERVLKRLAKQEDGFTLPELMVTIMMMLLVLGALHSIFDMSLRVFSFGNDKVEAAENARIGLERMEREIRAAYPYDKASNPVPSTPPPLFEEWTATTIKFGNELNGNRKIECVVGGTCETIRYGVYETGVPGRYALGRLNSATGSQQAVVEYMDFASPTDTGLSFKYFEVPDGGGSLVEVIPGLGSEASIDVVRITVEVRILYGDPGSTTDDRTQTLSTDVALRNRGA